jgi:uncharacterized protein (TIGR01619 family)
MAENWKFYLCHVNEKLASLYFDAALRKGAPMLSKPNLLYVWLVMKTPRSDGLSHNEEAEQLWKIEDALTKQVVAICDAEFAGRITTQGRREFYFYGASTNKFSNAVSAVMQTFPEYKFLVDTKEDFEWNLYLEVLYPSPEEWQRIGNRDVLDTLKEKGDVHSVVREVRHWIYFANKKDRDHCKKKCAASGFKFFKENKTKIGTKSFCLEILKSQPVEQETIDATVMELFVLAEECNGEYDGWETKIMSN